MAEKINNISQPRKGINSDVNPSDLRETEYSFALNTNISSDVGDVFLLQNEPSNILCNNFPAGFVVVGREYDVNSNRTFFFLTNPTSKVSQIGYIDNINNIVNVEDVEHQCNCNISEILAEPLENQTQVATCTYTSIVNDSCNLCLGFDKNFPIKKIVIKNDTTGTTLWWTDGNQTMRWLNVDELEQYSYVGEESCESNTIIPTCLDCEKLRVFREFEQPIIIPQTIQQGGNLKAGSYEILVAYSDLKGNEISSYFSITNPIQIFDRNNNILTQPELEYETDFGIRLNVNNLDLTYPYYKIAVIYTGGINGTTYYSGQVYSTSDREINLTTLKDFQSISFSKLAVPKKTYEKAEGLASSNGTLYWYGTTEQEEINFQPCANLLGGFLRWITVEAKEDLYADGVNNSLYKSYLRDEVYPFAIQLLFDNGAYSADFPLINRPPLATDLETVNNLDTQSILEYAPNCSAETRNQRWQFYNTSTDEGFYETTSDNYNTVTRQITKQCEVQNVYSQPTLTLDIPCSVDYSNLADYIDRYRTQICDSGSENYDLELCDILSNLYAGQTCNFSELFQNNCDQPPVLVEGSTEVFLSNTDSENVDVNYLSVEDMIPNQPPQVCNTYRPGTNSQGYQNDVSFESDFMSISEQAWFRSAPLSNTDCIYATNLNSSIVAAPYYLQYQGDKTSITNLQTSKSSISSGSTFTSFLHQKAIWYKVDFGAEEAVVFEISKAPQCQASDDIPIGTEIRMTTYNNCQTNDYIYSEVVDLNDGSLVLLNKADYPSGFAYIAIDSPINTKTRSYYTDPTNPMSPVLTETVYIVSPPCSCFNVVVRNQECTSKTVTVDNPTFSKRARYTTNCEFRVPIDNGCAPNPYKYGKLGYWQSDENYPDNNELFNSNSLNLDVNQMPADYRAEFTQYYLENGALNADFTCQPIRHYRMPDFAISPFMSTEELPSFADSFIYPLGVTLDENLINYFLDVAVASNLLSLEQRQRVVGYKIKSGDRTLNKSIIAKGVSYDMFKYSEVGAVDTSEQNQVWFSNFPYNDNRENQLLYTNEDRNTYIQHPTSGGSNYRFTFHSPETSFNKPTLPNELKVEAFQYGNSRGNFVNVEDHVKNVILGKDAYQLANTLSILESALELAITLADFTINAAQTTYTVVFAGAGSSGVGQNFAGVGVSTAALITYGIAAAAGQVVKTGQYRKQWLDIFYNLGQPRNFASYYTSVGNYNYAFPNNVEGQQLRAIKTNKYLLPGNYQFTEDVTGENIKVNNRDRETSVFLSTGQDYPISYPTEFRGFDQSRTIASEATNCENSNVSSTFETPIASPYFSIKNYTPSQYGQIGNIKWLSTGYIGDLRNPLEFPQVFGGDIFISRFALKRKQSLFKSTAMNLASRTPFNYSIERNIGVPRFYADFDTTEDEANLGSALFPSITTDYTFDCLSGKNGMYLKHPSKFYLFYYGIPNFLVESEINVNYRYAKEAPENNFYPNTEDFINWTQEKNVPIRQDNTFYYNNAYSKKVSQILNKSLPIDYDSEYFRKIVYQPNQIFYSLQDVSAIDRFEPWMAYKPLDFHLFDNSYGKLISLDDIESAQVIARFENGFKRFNSIDVLRERITPETLELGTAGIFAQRPLEFKKAKLGYGGTQNAEIISTELGHFWADAKRGQVFQLDQNGEQLKDITTGVARRFKEQLPFKILKTVKDANVDNAYNGVGIAMSWDSKNKRLFLTKKDYIPKDDCVRYDEELGWVINESLCGEDPVITCPENYTYNQDTGLCERVVTYAKCPAGYTYNALTNTCEIQNTTIYPPCPPAVGYFTGGTFTTPAQRIANPNLTLPSISDGGVIVMKRDSLGRILVGGSFTTVNGLTRNKLIRLNANGTLDGTFNVGTGFTGASVSCLDIYPDDSIIVGGFFSAYKGNTAQGLVRILSNGDYDPTFDTTTGFATRNPWDVKIVEDDKILVATQNDTYKGELTKGLFKVMPNGDYDTSFGGGDRFNTSANLGTDQRCESIEVDSLGRYIVSGRAIDYDGNPSRKIVRLYPDGTFDSSFNIGSGFQFTGQSEFNIIVYKVQLQGSNILCAGRFELFNGQSAQGIIRLNPTGQLDATFNNNKIIGGSTNITDRLIYDFDTNQEGEILIGGNYSSYAGNGIAYITLTDVNGFVQPFTNPNYNNIVTNVLNAPRCQQCEAPCTGTTLPNGSIECTCITSIPANNCQGDCTTVGSNCVCTVTEQPTIVDILTPIDINDPTYFEEISWTAAYSPLTESWISYYSFKPNYYVSHQNYFQTGLNSGTKKGLWSHLLTNRSYQVFYGDIYPWIVEVPEKPSLDNKILSNINFIVDSERYHNEYDIAPFPKIGFDQMVIYNQTNNSGLIKLVAEEKNNLRQKTLYPITNNDSQEVLVTKYEDKFNVNYFYNRVKSEQNNVPTWMKDKVDVEKSINLQNITYKSHLPERMRGNWFLIRFYKTGDSNIKSIFKFNISEDYITPP